jgi:hypothetical protein
MTDTPRATIEKLFANGVGVRVDFYWVGDRYSHIISSVKDGVATAEWQSVDDDPLGPVYQELHEQENADGGKIVFLSGAGGGAHWSASVFVVEATKFNLMFDVAARVGREPLDRVIAYRGVWDNPPATSWSPDGDYEVDWEAPWIRFQLRTPGTLTVPATLRTKYSIMP